MTKEDSIQKCLDAQKAAVGQVWDDCMASNPPVIVPSGFTQADMDAAVKAAQDAAKIQQDAAVAQAIADEKAKIKSDLSAVNAELG